MHLNNKGFAISGVLYSMLILIVTLMFLILGILAGRRTTLNKISSESQESVEDRVVLIEKTVCNSIDFSNSTLYTYNSSKKEQTVELETGFYLIQAWGAAGSKSNRSNGYGGKGAYVSTIYNAETNQTIYLNIGDGYNLAKNTTAYNGGGVSKYGGGGGGATSVATVSGELSTLSSNKNSIILVAAGGGGGGNYQAGGAGGDLVSGVNGTAHGTDTTSLKYRGMGATATEGGAGGAAYTSNSNTYPNSAGKAGSFGKGGAAGTQSSSYTGGGGGGGYYGGGGGSSYSSTRYGSGGGGVSYIDGAHLASTTKIIKNGGIFASQTTYKTYVGVGINGNSVMPNPLPADDNSESILTVTQTGNNNKGYVRITKLECVTTIENY